MLYSKEMEGLRDNGHEGLVDEHLIFREVFFGNLNSDNDKDKDVSIIPKSENSAMSSQVDSYNVKDESRDDYPDVNAKRMKFSDDKLLNGKPFLKEEFNSSTFLEDFSGMSPPTSIPIYHPVMHRLVESSNHGVTSSCYLLNQYADVERGCDVDASDTPNHRSSSLGGSDQKVVVANKAIASPVSQESCVTKLLVTNPTVVPVADKAGTPRVAKRKWKDSCFVEIDIAEFSVPLDSKTDPKSLLRYHINCLLIAAGWVLGRRKRSVKYRFLGEYVYKSPEGRPIREFRKAWALCGQSLFGDDGNNVEQGNDFNKWTDISQFCSDLSNTLAEIKEHHNLETTTALAHRWYLLDPFAIFLFISKKYSLLKSGNLAKAEKSLMVLTNTKRKSIFNQKYNGFDFSGGVGNLNTSFGGSETFSSNHDSDSSSLRHHKYGSNHNEEVLLSDIKYMSSSGEEAPTLEMGDASFAADAALKRKAYKKSEKISEMELVTSCRKNELGLSTSYEVRRPGVEECFAANTRCGQSHKDALLRSQHQNDKRQSKCKNRHSSGSFRKSAQVNNNSEYLKELNFDNSTNETPLNLKSKSPTSQKLRHVIKFKKLESQGGQNKSLACEIKDDDLLVSAIIKNKSFITPTKLSSAKRISLKSKARRKRRSQKGCCRLLPRSVNKGGKLYVEGEGYAFASRTVLSWLINSGVISLNEVIQYRNPKDDDVVKEGLVTRDGILCRCCKKVLSLSEFKSHAGFRLNRPCLNLFMESGKPFTLCQLEAWSAEYKTRKGAAGTVLADTRDHNDDSCGLCGDVGELICCDNCPSTFHQACLYAQELPEGNWYCPQCTCRICGNLVSDEEISKSPSAMKCSQCQLKYHESCLEERDVKGPVASDTWFCGNSCQEVYLGLHSRIGRINQLFGGYSWTLIRCIDQKVHSAQRFVALKAECNLKLAVAVTIMEECFLPMVDRRTGIDMIPHVLYNWGSEFARLNYQGFHTVVLEKDDVLISVASIRIHGAKVAEMPLIATCSKYRRQGMCRRLMNAIEEMLKSFKVETLVLSAIPSLVETWTVGFGFKPLEDGEKQTLSKTNMMVFPGTVWLKKPLYENQMVDQQTGACRASCSETDDPTKAGPCFEGSLTMESAQHSDRNSGIKEVEILSSHPEANGPAINGACSTEGLVTESFQRSDINLCVKVEQISCSTPQCHASHTETDDPTKTRPCFEGNPTTEYAKHSDINSIIKESMPGSSHASQPETDGPTITKDSSDESSHQETDDDPAITGFCSEGGLIFESVINSCIKEVGADTYIGLTDDQNLQPGEDRDGGLHNQNSGEGNQLGTVGHLDSLDMYDNDDRKLPLNENMRESNVL